MRTIFILGFILSTFVFAAKESADSAVKETVAALDKSSVSFNSNPKDPKRVENLLKAYEDLMGRTFTVDEKKFLSLEFKDAVAVPRFEMKKKIITAFHESPEGRSDLLKLELVDAKKGTVKINNKVFELKNQKTFLQNIQGILQELNKDAN